MKALITDSVHPLMLEEFASARIPFTYLPSIDYNEVLEIIEDYTILIINSKIPINEKLLSKASRLKKVGRLGSGLEIIDFDACLKYGVQVFSSPEGNRDAVAEHAVGMLLSLFNKLNASHYEVLNFSWNREMVRGEELKGKTIGIIGFGNTGQAFAKKMSGFDVEVLFYDKYLKDATNQFATQVSLTDLQRNADVISFHVPLTDETIHYCDTTFINACKKAIYIINTSRGKVLCLNDLLSSIQQNKVLGACLDVFEEENKNFFDNAYKQLIINLNKTDKVLFSPHVAGWTHQSKFKLAEILTKKILAKP